MTVSRKSFRRVGLEAGGGDEENGVGGGVGGPTSAERWLRNRALLWELQCDSVQNSSRRKSGGGIRSIFQCFVDLRRLSWK